MADEIKRLMEERILVLDGAMGTAIQARGLTAADFGGEALEGCNEYLNIMRPDIIRAIHEDNLRAGCDIVETNTFGGTPLVLAEYGLHEQAEAISLAACRIAREAADRFSTPERPRFVAGSIGPTTKAISVTGGISFEGLRETFYVQARALLKGGADYFLVETCQDTRNIKACLLAIEKLFAEEGKRIPVAVSVTIEPMGTMLAGQGVEALIASLSHFDLLYLGLNCATGPEFMTDSIRTLAQKSPFPVSCVPNAGLPDQNGCYLESPKMMADVLARFIDRGWINFIGGCCGTEPSHIAAFAELAKGKKPHVSQPQSRSLLSGIECLEITDESRPLLVGERTNVIGSRKFKQMICEEKFDEAAEVGKSQVKHGAHLLDVCLANPDRNEKDDTKELLERLIQKIKVPLVIDSTDEKVIALALTYCQGKSLINSINLEDGEERFEKVVPLAKEFGAALVVGTIDEDPQQGMAITKERKLAIADRSYRLLTEKYGFPATDIYWDPLVFPCGTGDQQYVGSAVETIEGIRLLKQHFPATKTILGISNVSFGLPTAGRETLNAVFLYHCVQSGLDLAIVNSRSLERYALIPEPDRKICEDLLWNRTPTCLADFAAHFRVKKVKQKATSTLPLEERLAQYIVEGSKDGLEADLNEALQKYKPLEIINGPLMKGMDEVGRLFNANQMIVAEVLQSAESMKAAVAVLEPHMEKSESASRGKVILATVKGDVHDIGKNLVDIIFSNNGFNVINLGIKVASEQLIQSIREHRPNIVGLSGLLVKSAQQMVVTVDDFAKAAIDTPVLVGGAALSSQFVDRQIAPAYATGFVAYAKDAMQGLELAKTIVTPERFETFKAQLDENRRNLPDLVVNKAKSADPPPDAKSSILPVEQVPPVPDFERHAWHNRPDCELLWRYVNPMMLFGRHLGLKGEIVRLLSAAAEKPALRGEIEQRDPRALPLWETVQEVRETYKQNLPASSVYQFFKAHSDKGNLHVGDDVVFQFPRQKKEPWLCLSDFVHPQREKEDAIALFVVTIGRDIRQIATELKDKGDYLHSHVLQAVALELAEGYAEYLHAQIRRLWGFPDAPEMTMLERFQAKYHGKRYSFGYPACPELADQRKIFQLLKPEEIGVQLTSGDMMDPEASVSALVLHHPHASYFTV